MRIVETKHFDKQANRRFTAFLNANELKVGDEYAIADYINWINVRLLEFKKANGIKGLEPINRVQEGQRKFTEYLERG